MYSSKNKIWKQIVDFDQKSSEQNASTPGIKLKNQPQNQRVEDWDHEVKLGGPGIQITGAEKRPDEDLGERRRIDHKNDEIKWTAA